MIKVLQELSALDGGGVAKLIYDYYYNMDHTKIRFDFLIYDFYDKGIYEDKLRNLGCKIYKIPRLKKDVIEYIKNIKKILSSEKYDVIHSHLGIRGVFLMYYGKKYGVKKRILHSHSAYENISFGKKIINKIITIIAKNYTTDLFACGKDAGIYAWGKKSIDEKKVYIMSNAIDTTKFKFSMDIRLKKRKELEVEGKFVIGIVARLSEQKNYPFLFNVYKKLISLDKDFVLIVVGRGIDESKIKILSKKMNIYNRIKFLGVRSDVNELLNAFDIYVLPSLYEGLPISLVEAQANGLYEFVSNKITKEVAVTNLVEFLPIEINKSEDLWVNRILEYKKNKRNINRELYFKEIIKHGYDIGIESLKIQNYYLKMKG